MNTLKRAEEQIMMVLCKLKNGLLMDIVEQMPSPQPHRNTVATVLKTMTDKGFVPVTVEGRNHRYHPKISISIYSKNSLARIAKGYFEGSFSSVVSFFVEENKVTAADIELLLKQIKKNKK